MSICYFADAYIPNQYTIFYAPLEWSIQDYGTHHLPWWSRSVIINNDYVENNWADWAILWDFASVEPTWWYMPPLSMTVWARAKWAWYGWFWVLLWYYNGTMKTMYSLLFIPDYTQVWASYLQELIAWNNIYASVDTSVWHCYGMATDWPNCYLYIDWQLAATTSSRPTTWWPDWSASYVGVLNRWWWDVCNGMAWWAVIENRLNSQARFQNYYDKTKDFYNSL